MIKRIFRMSRKQALAKLNNAYRVLLGGEIEQETISAEQLKEFGYLIQMDVVGFSKFGEYPAMTSVNHDEMLIIEGRRQMAAHILKHLDITPREIIENLNDSITQNKEIYDD